MKRVSNYSMAKAAKRMLGSGSRKLVCTAVAVTVSLGLLTGYSYWPRSPISLAQSDNLSNVGLYASWQAGDVVVLVRHAERCDRSSNPCLGPEDGITVHGNAVSTEMGKSFKTLGLERTDVITSPATRTVQTASALFGQPAPAENWLYDCENLRLPEVMAHKKSHRNLVLVTHSGCISKLERQQGYRHAATSEYNGALFISQDAQGQARILGIVNPGDWKQLTKHNGDTAAR
jgi:phosphohistidine phosphatase SixA